LDDANMVAQIKQGKFFGEMGSLLSGGRSATIKAHSDLQVLMIPFLLFQDVLKYSSDADQKVIEMLSERLRDVNEKLIGDDQASR
ncbi:cyclic nucleotide-binding domain-containing protein, partial [Treponema sp. R80B11-R83G3]